MVKLIRIKRITSSVFSTYIYFNDRDGERGKFLEEYDQDHNGKTMISMKSLEWLIEETYQYGWGYDDHTYLSDGYYGLSTNELKGIRNLHHYLLTVKERNLPKQGEN